MDPIQAIKPHPRGCTIRFEVVPGSSQLNVPAGYNPWREALIAKLQEEPERGRANHQLIAEVARILCIPEANIEVLSGIKNSRKVLLAKGVNAQAAISALCLNLK